MKPTIPTITFRRAFFTLIWLFAILFLARLAYSFREKKESQEQFGSGPSFFADKGSFRKNYASEKSYEPAPPPNAPDGGSSQKYEKTATLNARTDAFQEDENRLRSTSTGFQAVIQYEQKSGNPGHRNLHLMIGVKPELFDSFYVAVQRIGDIYINEVTKVDKTTEFRELNAQKASLQKALLSLNDLKNRAGSISDLVGLHEKILDVERQLQELGVELGNFSAENEFCTVRFSLHEKAAARTISFVNRVIDAFIWTVQYYALGLFFLGGMLLVAWLMLVVAKNVRETVKKNDE
ncbi:MAG: DUF4349 domain-containing protein [Saprospiraceae bacterium]|nr:DUF4349 domain-containing protein [Saprospiraceae bacterium]